jgi:hypothetical protein
LQKKEKEIMDIASNGKTWESSIAVERQLDKLSTAKDLLLGERSELVKESEREIRRKRKLLQRYEARKETEISSTLREKFKKATRNKNLNS